MRAIGLMSGTSMDGVDAALVETDGETIAAYGPSRFLPYAPDYRALMAEANRAAPGVPTAALRDPAAWPAAFHALAAATVQLHAEAVAALGAPADVVGFHGQTVAHRPDGGVTLQLGHGGALARTVGARVVWDFRSADMAAGGQGAPLVPFYHFALARRIGAHRPLAILNIGGVANVTWIDPSRAGPEAPGALLAFDCGPGNALLDDLMQARTGEPMDRGGRTAAAGRADAGLVAAVMAAPFFRRRPPKSLDRNDFALPKRFDALPLPDAAATLAAITVEGVVAARAHLPAPPACWLVAGGGRRNAHLMAGLAARLPEPVAPIESASLDGDMIEAEAFAYLAARVLRGLPTSAPATTGCRWPVSGGRVADP